MISALSSYQCVNHCSIIIQETSDWGQTPPPPLPRSTESVVLLSNVPIIGLSSIDLFTDTAAIFNLSDLTSIMGCPGGTRSVFTRAFRAKRELQRIFLGKKVFVITCKDGTTIFFSHYNLFLGKIKKNFSRKN